jgi:hypothetical protein
MKSSPGCMPLVGKYDVISFWTRKDRCLDVVIA